MKHYNLYLVYLLLDKEVLNTYEISTLIFDGSNIPNLNNDNVRFIETLYAVTDDKSKLDSFLSFRNKSKFRYETKKFNNKKKLEKNLNKLGNLILETNKLDDRKGEYSIVCNINELDNIDEEISEMEYVISDACTLPYNILNKKYIKALDMLVYTYFYNIFNSGDDGVAECADFSVNGYNQSVEGYVTSNFGYHLSSINVLINGILSYTIK